MEKEINVLAMMKGKERFVFLYDDQNRVETLRMLGRFAADPDLNFTWYDAALMSKKIRDMAAHNKSSAPQARRQEKSRHGWQAHPRFKLPREEDIL